MSKRTGTLFFLPVITQGTGEMMQREAITEIDLVYHDNIQPMYKRPGKNLESETLQRLIHVTSRSAGYEEHHEPKHVE